MLRGHVDRLVVRLDTDPGTQGGAMTHTSRTSMQAIVVAAVLSGSFAPAATHVGVRKAAAPPPPMQVDATAELGSAEQRAQLGYKKLPLAFVPNAGQTDAPVRFQAQA